MQTDMEAVSDYFQKAFAGVLNYLLCRIFALKILQHMSERSEFVLQNLWF